MFSITLLPLCCDLYSYEKHENTGELSDTNRANPDTLISSGSQMENLSLLISPFSITEDQEGSPG